MSGLIKSRDASMSQVRSMGAARTVASATPAVAAPREEDLAAQRRIEALEEALAARDAEIERLEAKVDSTREAALDEGRKLGLEAAQSRADDALRAVETGAEQALALYAQELASLERLSAALVEECLSRLVGDDETRKALLQDMIRTQLDRIDRAAVIRLEVSHHDYDGPDALYALIAVLNSPRFDIRIGDDLPAGGCRIGLALGTLEVGLDQQWTRLRDLLVDLATPSSTS